MKKLPAWNKAACDALVDDLWKVRDALVACEAAAASWLEGIDRRHRASARNLLHYLALRRADRRALQDRLAQLGLSSLGRAESNVLANLDKVLGILHRLAGRPWQPRSADEPVGIRSSRRLVKRRTVGLLGAAPGGRAVRIMVTLPSEAAHDFDMVRRMVAAGMDIARINCAHDGPAEWEAMASHVRRAARAARRAVRVLMDLGGPKLRTGPMPPRPGVLKLRPQRDEFGHVVAPATLLLHPAGHAPAAARHPAIGVDAAWLARLRAGQQLDFTDARGASRRLKLVASDAHAWLAESMQTAYLVPETRLERRAQAGVDATRLADFPERRGYALLKRGERVRLVAEAAEPPPAPGPAGKRGKPVTTITCTLPAVFDQVAAGERIWFDDGRIGGRIRRAGRRGIEVEITHALGDVQKLAGDKGINLPDSKLDLPALTERDVVDLESVARLADMVGLSFVQRGADLACLRTHLQRLGKPDLGIVLKIETRRAFENLPELLFAALAGKAAGVMIARGDLAVECGYERLAEVQEEILWAAEAAHLPVIWATQVLDMLARTGTPSRAEITDAAMGERAECVMLNKGPFIDAAIHALDDILRRMQSHQSKKRPLLRALKSWGEPTRKKSARDPRR